ncbi:MAG TPA: FHA domain-containing protein, partial [Agromyces sp.]|nr:FHA domain-containing protein [Agromyces sp.]
ERTRLPSLATDRALDEHTFIPGSRSSSGVVSAGTGAEWTPPPIAPVASVARPATGATPGTQPAAQAPAAATPGTQPAAQAPSARADATTEHGYVLVFDDGIRFAASATGLIGRAPAPDAGEQIGQLVPLTDESMRISKTHAAFGVDGTGFWVTDRSSKNGTVAEFPDGSTRALAPGVRHALPPGTRVVLGGRSFTLVNAPEVGR